MTETINVINKKLPYPEDVGIEDSLNEIVKTLNSATIQTSSIQSSSISNLSGIGKYADVEITFNNPNTSITTNHNLSAIPTGWIVIDSTESGSYNIDGLYRTSWNTSQISFSLKISGGPYSLYYKIRVFI